MIFDGKKIKTEIMSELASRILKLGRKPTLAAIWLGNDEVTAKYVQIKQRTAEKLGIHFDIIKFDAKTSQNIIIERINELNQDDKVDGLMVQMPLPKNFNSMKIIESIESSKDVDGLRYCANMPSSIFPPVVAAIILALEMADKSIYNKKITVIGRGFLVGSPLIRYLEDKTDKIRIGDSGTPYLATITQDADVVISAVGKPKLITANMVKDDVILVDAGTSEAGGALAGDIDPKAYQKASFYTPTPGGIGPVTVAMLFRNVVEAAEKTNN